MKMVCGGGGRLVGGRGGKGFGRGEELENMPAKNVWTTLIGNNA